MKKLELFSFILVSLILMLGACSNPDTTGTNEEEPGIQSTPTPNQETTLITDKEEDIVQTENEIEEEKESPTEESPTVPESSPPVQKDYSISWRSDVQITSTGLPSFYPTLGVSGSKVHLAWVDQRDGGQNREIYYNRSIDNGTTWQPSDKKISDNPLYSIRTDFAINNEIVHLFWRDNRDGNFEEYYSRSTDNGISWSSECRLTNNQGLSGCPFPVVNGNTINVFFRDDRSGTFKIYQKRSTDSGITWSEDILLTPEGTKAEFPFPAVNNNTIHLVWRDTRDGNAEIYYKRSIDGGLNWTEDRRLTNNNAESEHPKIIVIGNDLHLVWRDNRDNSYEVYYKKSTDAGETWSQDLKITGGQGNSFWPVLASSENLIHLLWCDERDGIQSLYYMYSSDDGNNWSEEVRLTDCVLPLDADIMAAHPILATDQYIHVVFNDDRTGENEIYYKQGNITFK